MGKFLIGLFCMKGGGPAAGKTRRGQKKKEGNTKFRLGPDKNVLEKVKRNGAVCAPFRLLFPWKKNNDGFRSPSDAGRYQTENSRSLYTGKGQ